MKMRSFEFKLDRALGLIKENEDRRSFLKKMGRIGGSVATGNPAAIGHMALDSALGKSVDLLANISDEELMFTPETEWIDKVSPSRLQRMVDKGYSIDQEFAQKMYAIMVYGLNIMQRDPTLKMMAKAMDNAGIDKSKMLESGLDKSEWLFDDLHNFGNIYAPKPGQLASTIFAAAKKTGIEISPSFKQELMQRDVTSYKIQKEYWEKLEKERAKEMKRETEEADRIRKDGSDRRRFDDAKYNSSKMHQPFESKLEKALKEILG